VLYELMSL